MSSNVKSSWVTRYRDVITRLCQVFEDAAKLKVEYDFGLYVTGGANELVTSDFTGANAGVTPTEMVNCLNALEIMRTQTAINANFNTHATNLYKVKNSS